MAQTYRKTRVVGNPGRHAFGSLKKKKKKYTRSKHAHRSNTGAEILGFTLVNPGRKGKMAKSRKKKSNRAKGYAKSAAHRHNTGHVKHHKKHYRRNVGGGGMSGFAPLVTNAAFVIIGALGSKLATQAILGTKNVGVLGYAGNAAVGGILWFITEKVMKNRAASTGVISGTIVQILLRIINDYTPFGQYVAQLGMGDYQMQSFVTPQVLVDPWRSAEIAIPPGWAPRMAAALPAAGAPAGGGGPAASMPAAVGGGGGVSGLYGNGGGWGPGLYSA